MGPFDAQCLGVLVIRFPKVSIAAANREASPKVDDAIE